MLNLASRIDRRSPDSIYFLALLNFKYFPNTHRFINVSKSHYPKTLCI